MLFQIICVSTLSCGELNNLHIADARYAYDFYEKPPKQFPELFMDMGILLSNQNIQH